LIQNSNGVQRLSQSRASVANHVRIVEGL
jgi:hypothetical protein